MFSWARAQGDQYSVSKRLHSHKSGRNGMESSACQLWSGAICVHAAAARLEFAVQEEATALMTRLPRSLTMELFTWLSARPLELPCSVMCPSDLPHEFAKGTSSLRLPTASWHLADVAKVPEILRLRAVGHIGDAAQAGVNVAPPPPQESVPPLGSSVRFPLESYLHKLRPEIIAPVSWAIVDPNFLSLA